MTTSCSDYPEGSFDWLSEDMMLTMMAQLERCLRDSDADNSMAACNALWLAANFIQTHETIDDRLRRLFWYVRDIVILVLEMEDDIPDRVRERMEQWEGFMHKAIPELWPERDAALREISRKANEARLAQREAQRQKEIDDAASAFVAVSKGEASA